MKRAAGQTRRDPTIHMCSCASAPAPPREESPAEPCAEPCDVHTKPKILPIEIAWERVEEATNNKLKRYVLDAGRRTSGCGTL